MTKKSLILLTTACGLIVLCYFFVDRQLVWFLVKHHSSQFHWLRYFSDSTVNTLTALIFGFYAYFGIKLLRSSVNKTDVKWLTVCNAVVIGTFLKTIFKFIFARYWPATFDCNNLSLISNDVYGFAWFKHGHDFGSFPSGHACFVFAFAVSIWYLFPKLRWFCVLVVAVVITGLLGLYYHFVSDVIAGAILGTLVALGCVKATKITAEL